MVIQSSDAKSLKRWRIVLAILLAAIVGLVATIVVLNLVKGNNDSGETEQPETDEQQLSLGVFMMNLDDTARGLYEKDPNNIQAIVDVYSKSFNQMIKIENYAFAYMVFQEEYEYLNEINVSAPIILDALLDIIDTDDFEFPGYMSQYNICHRIIEVAERAGNTAVIEKYRPYLEEARPSYEKYVNRTNRDE